MPVPSPLWTLAGAVAQWRAKMHMEIERGEECHCLPLDRLLLTASACWMSLISSGARQEGDDDRDAYLDLLLLLLTKQLASGVPIFGNSKCVQNIRERRCMKEHYKFPSPPGTMVTRCTKHSSCSHLGLISALHTAEGSRKSMMYFVLKKKIE